MNDTHVMIDIETLDTVETAVIVSVGMVSFTIEDGIQERFLWNLDLDSQVNDWNRRTISPRCVKWWMDSGLFLPEVGIVSEITFTHEFINALDRLNPSKVWYKGPLFDHVILKHFLGNYDQNLDKLVAFWKVRDARTLNEFKIFRDRDPVSHNALDDAEQQALDVIHVITTVSQLSNQDNK